MIMMDMVDDTRSTSIGESNQTLCIKQICPTNTETQVSTPLTLGTCIQLISQAEIQEVGFSICSVCVI